MRRLIGSCLLALAMGCGGGGGAGPGTHTGDASDGADHPLADDDGGAEVAVEAPGDEGTTDAGSDVGGGEADRSSDGDSDVGRGAEAGADVAFDAHADLASDAADAGVEPETAVRFVTVAFAGQVVTVAGTPLGFDGTARLAPVSGSFSYEAGLLDKQPDAKRGLYWNVAATTFTFTVKGHTVTGSGKAIIQTEDLDPDTIRFLDGPQGDAVVRTMKVDGADTPALKLVIAITDTSGVMLKSDALPDPFPTVDIAHKDGGFDIAHTFSLMDGGGTLLMQLDTLANQ